MDFDPQAGFEQKGVRPALVVSNNKYNRHCKMAMVCPISNTDKNHPFHVRLGDDTQTAGIILCGQARALDVVARNASYKETVSDDILDEVVDLICSFVDNGD